LITGITGQDGAYLARLLLERGYRVIGGVRRTSSENLWRLAELGIADKVQFAPFDLLEFSNIVSLVGEIKPSVIFNLGAQSFVGTSFTQPILTSEIDAIGCLRLLEAIRHYSKETRFYQASTSEMFGKIREPVQNENTPFHPRSPYGVAKLFAHHITMNYREAYGLHASSGILFNHESPLRGREFVTRKVSSQLALIRHGKADILELGNLGACRDWGHARDYVEGMARMVEKPEPDDYVLATGVTTTVREFVLLAGKAAGFDLAFEGEGVGETAIDRKSGKLVVRVNPQFFRPAEVDVLVGDPAKALKKLGWSTTTTLATLAEEMVAADLNRVAKGFELY
jgi:GDPmannose 4,6-dehydratase